MLMAFSRMGLGGSKPQQLDKNQSMKLKNACEQFSPTPCVCRNLTESECETHGIYKRSKWSPEMLRYMVLNGYVTPLYMFQENQSSSHQISCQICYLYYPKINETHCCHHLICTECLASIIDLPPSTKFRVCPFCRQECFSIKPCVDSVRIPGGANGDDPEFLKYEERRKQGLEDKPITNKKPPINYPNEVLELANQFHADPDTIHNLMQAGLTQEDIISQFI